MEVGPSNARKGVEQKYSKRCHEDGEVFAATPACATEKLDADISGIDPVIDDNGEKEGEGHPDGGRAESPSHVQAKDHPVKYVKENDDDRELLDGEIERKEI